MSSELYYPHPDLFLFCPLNQAHHPHRLHEQPVLPGELFGVRNAEFLQDEKLCLHSRKHKFKLEICWKMSFPLQPKQIKRKGNII